MGANQRVSRYLEHLPAIFRQGRFIEPFLIAFERVLTGAPPGAAPLPGAPAGVEEVLDRIHTFFDPQATPAEFIPWLAGWVATSLRDDWDEATRRRFVASIVPLYKKRGTRAGLQEVLSLYVPGTVVIDHDDDVVPPVVDASFPHFFLVSMPIAATAADAAALAQKVRSAIAVIDREKPAHTYYAIDLDYVGMQISDTATTSSGPDDLGVQVGVTTLVGASPRELLHRALQINDAPDQDPQYGPGVLVSVNTLLGTEP